MTRSVLPDDLALIVRDNALAAQALAGSVQIDSFTKFAYQNGYNDFSEVHTDQPGWTPGAYTKDRAGFVHLAGLVSKAVTPWAQGDLVTVLPIGYRPALAEMFWTTLTVFPAGHWQIRWSLLPTGQFFVSELVNVLPGNASTSPPTPTAGIVDYAPLSGITFYAGAS